MENTPDPLGYCREDPWANDDDDDDDDDGEVRSHYDFVSAISLLDIEIGAIYAARVFSDRT